MKITENTTVTIGLLIVIIGGVVWLTRINFLAESAASMAQETKTLQERYVTDVIELKNDVKWIKHRMGGED